MCERCPSGSAGASQRSPNDDLIIAVKAANCCEATIITAGPRTLLITFLFLTFDDNPAKLCQ